MRLDSSDPDVDTTGWRTAYSARAGTWNTHAQMRVMRWCHANATGHWRLSRMSDPAGGSEVVMEVSFDNPEDHMLFVLSNPTMAFS